jgi:hypothetical protein
MFHIAYNCCGNVNVRYKISKLKDMKEKFNRYIQNCRFILLSSYTNEATTFVFKEILLSIYFGCSDNRREGKERDNIFLKR